MNFNLEFFKTEAITKRGKERGYSYFSQGYIHHIFIGGGKQEIFIQAGCLRSMRKSEAPHMLNMVVSEDQRELREPSLPLIINTLLPTQPLAHTRQLLHWVSIR